MTNKREKKLTKGLTQPTFFDENTLVENVGPCVSAPDEQPKARKASKPRMPREDIRAIQDLLWKEALLAVQDVERFEDVEGFQEHLRRELPQNSLETRSRYGQTLVRWFFPDGVRGLVASVWVNYREPSLVEEVLRCLYLQAEPMMSAAVTDALFPIAENAVIPPSYLTNFIQQRFGEETPAKSIKRVKSNLRKLGFLVKEKGNQDALRPMSPSSTGFLIILHYLFARNEAHGIEFRTLADNPFWKYLGFKSEDQLRSILKESLNKGLIAKYLVADRIESISFRFSFAQFVTERKRL